MPTLSKSSMKYEKGKLSNKVLLQLYEQLLKPRMIEEKMLILLRSGKISKWFSGIGQEAISVGATAALEAHEVMFPMHRNLGVFTTRGIPLVNLFCQWQGKAPGFTKGRDRSFHFGTMDYNTVGMISHLGPQLSLASGVALANKLSNSKEVSLAFTGEGGTSEGEFHEALNVAAVWQLPVIFVIENNGYGLSTPVSEQYRCENLADRGLGYGMRSIIVDGNNILEVYNTFSKLAKELRKKPEPVLVECKTFRMRGHEEASGTKYVPKKLMEEWAKKDPLQNYEDFLLEEKVLTEDKIVTLRAQFKTEIEEGLEAAGMEAVVSSTTETEMADVFLPHEAEIVHAQGPSTEKRLIDAISDGLRQSMQKYDKLVLMGQDIAEYGGVFKITDGFVKEFGNGRVRNTPLCESAIIGIGIGLGLKGWKSMVEMQFADFVTCGFNQIINNAAKLHYRWGQNVDMVIRMPTGGGVGAGPFHSQSNEAWFTHTPGLKVVYPSNPIDAKGLLTAAIEDPNPVMYFEHKGLYRSVSAEVPDAYYTLPIGKAAIKRTGTDLSVITYGMGVHWAEKVIEEMGIDAEIIDLRTLVPLDYDTIEDTIKKTGKAIILHEDSLFGGLGGEIAAHITEYLFEYLDGPVMRSASLDTPIPFAIPLEQNYLPVERFKAKLQQLLNY